MPGSGYAGNISFRKFSGVDENGSWKANPNYEEPNFNVLFSKVNIGDYKGVTSIGINVNEQIYQGFFPVSSGKNMMIRNQVIQVNMF